MATRLAVSIAITIGFGFLTQPLRAQTVIDTVCAGARGVEYHLVATMGSAYQWTVNGGEITGGNGTNSISVDWGTDTGRFEIKLLETSAQGCPGDTVRAFVWIRKGIEVNINGPKSICEGEEVRLTASGAMNLKWNTGARSASIWVKPTEDITYEVVGYSPYCGMDTARFGLKVHQRPVAQIQINPDAPGLNELVVFHAGGVKGDENANWSLAGLGPIGEGEQIFKKFTEAGNYKVQLVVIDPNGCIDSATQLFSINANVQVFIPNAFTPNGDNLNQVYAPVTNDVKQITMRIYDRWGALIHIGSNEDIGWNGLYKGTPVPEGVYLYQIEALGADGLNYVYDGTVTLIR